MLVIDNCLNYLKTSKFSSPSSHPVAQSSCQPPPSMPLHSPQPNYTTLHPATTNNLIGLLAALSMCSYAAATIVIPYTSEPFSRTKALAASLRTGDKVGDLDLARTAIYWCRIIRPCENLRSLLSVCEMHTSHH
jgi:hypothetical protein